MGAKNSKNKRSKTSTNTKTNHGNVFDNLRKMGYTLDECLDAIAKYGNNITECSNYLKSIQQPVPYQCGGQTKHKLTAADVDDNNTPPPTTTYEPYEAANYHKSSNKFEFNMKAILVTGYIRHVIFVLLGNDNDNSQSIMNIIPFDIVKLCEEYYEANMIMFIIQSSFNQSLLNGIECINLNCKKIIKFKTVSMDDTQNIVTLDQHWFDKTVHTYYLSDITIPRQAYTSYADILSPIKEPSIILKCKLNAWRIEHKPSMIIFDNRLLQNWTFTADNDDKYKLSNTKQIDAFEMQLPVITNNNRRSQLRMFVYSSHYGLLAMDNLGYNHNKFTIHRLKFSEIDEKCDDEKDSGWKWVKLETGSNVKMRAIQSVHGMCVIDSPSLEYGESEKLFMLSKITEHNYRRNDAYVAVKSMEMEVGYFDITLNAYRQLCRFEVNRKATQIDYYTSYSHGKAPITKHNGHQWIQPSLHYNKTHKKVFIGGDDTQCIEGYDTIKNKWIFLPETEYIHRKGCTLWSLNDQSNDILYIDKGTKKRKTDNFIELFDLRSNQQKWRISDHYMQWKDIVASNGTFDRLSRYDYHVYQRTFI